MRPTTTNIAAATAAALLLARNGARGFAPSVPRALATSSSRREAAAATGAAAARFATTTATTKTATEEATAAARTAPLYAATNGAASSSASSVIADDEPFPTSNDAWLDLTDDELDSLLRTATEACRAAGSIVLDNLGCCSQTSDLCSVDSVKVKTNMKDVVTEFDTEAQRAVEGVVRSAHPTHSFLGEEDVDPGSEASEAALVEALSSTPSGYVWIVDPIDGTANFAAGLPMCVVTIGVVYRGTPIVGVVYDPHRNEMFTAVRGKGAFLNGDVPLRVASAVTDMSDAIVNAGCPADPNAFDTSVKGIKALNPNCRGVRIVACSALTTAWIAAGRLSAHFGYDLSSWDLVAGALLIKEAGGLVTGLDGTPYRLETRDMLCSNGIIHGEVLGALREADAVSFERASLD